MDQAQEQKLSKYLQFQDHLNRSPEVLDYYPELKPLYELFSQRLILILKTKQMLDNCVQNKSLRDELIKTAVIFSRKITSFALLEDITELQCMGFSSQELMVNSDQHLIKTCEWVLSKSENFRNDLIDYGIDDILLKEFRNLIDQFKSSLYNNEISTDLVNQALEEFSRLFKETDEIFDGNLDSIILEPNSKS
jgi:hypothetical protein